MFCLESYLWAQNETLCIILYHNDNSKTWWWQKKFGVYILNVSIFYTSRDAAWPRQVLKTNSLCEQLICSEIYYVITWSVTKCKSQPLLPLFWYSACYIKHWSFDPMLQMWLMGKVTENLQLAFVSLPWEYIQWKQERWSITINVIWFSFNIYTCISVCFYHSKSVLSPLWIVFMDCCREALCWKWTLVYNSNAE